MKRGDDEKARALAERFPDDHMAAPTWNRVLALYRLGRLEEAETALTAARREAPNVYKFLCAENVARPRLTPGYVLSRGRDEAWYYREEHLDLWHESGALEWLRRSGRMRARGA